MTKTFKNKKTKTALVLMSMLLFTTVVAFALFQFDFSVENKFQAETLKIQMEESFSPPVSWQGEKVDKKVSYTNTGSTPALLRVLYSENFVHRDTGVSLSTKNPDDGVDIVKKNWDTKNGLDTSNWVAKDGWYYYKHLLNPGETIVTLESIEIPEFNKLSTEYQKADYQLSFTYEYIEAVEKIAATLWKIDQAKFGIASDGSITWGF